MESGSRSGAISRKPGAAPRCHLEFLLVSALACLLPAGLGGCATAQLALWESPPDNQDRIEVGAPRSLVEDILGEPIREDGPVRTYEYSSRERPNLALGAFIDVATMGMSVMYWGDMQEAYDAQRVRRSLVYGPDGRIVSLSPDTAEETFERWLGSERRGDSLELLCRAANDGQADAQAVEAVRYRYGLWGTQADPVKALLSIRLAAYFGNRAAIDTSEAWRRDMNADAVADAERRVASWQPDPAACNSEGAAVAQHAQE